MLVYLLEGRLPLITTARVGIENERVKAMYSISEGGALNKGQSRSY